MAACVVARSALVASVSVAVPPPKDSVTNVAELCQRESMEKVDAIICGLPWASFSESLQSEIMDAMLEVLAPGGQFATFAYWQGVVLPAGRLREPLSLLLLRAREAAMANLRPALQELGLTEPQWRVLLALEQHGDGSDVDDDQQHSDEFGAQQDEQPGR